jgi:hypothetical protein
MTNIYANSFFHENLIKLLNIWQPNGCRTDAPVARLYKTFK